MSRGWTRGAWALATLAGMVPVAAASGTLTVALNADIRSTEPGVNRDTNSDMVLAQVVEGLVATRADLSVAPMLADRVDMADEGRTYIFHLRDGVRFHDGRVLRAGDVRWSWDHWMDAARNWTCRSFYDGTGRGVKVLSVDTPDDLTVRFTLDRPSAVFLAQMASTQCPLAILSPSSVGADGHWIAPIGTGPFRLGEWRRGQYVMLERFDGYSARSDEASGLAGGKQALVDQVKFLIVPDVTTSQTALLSGGVDIIPALPAAAGQDLKRFSGVRVHEQELLSWTVLLLQSDDPVLSDVRIRRAIAHAIDRDGIAMVATNGLVKPNPSAVPRVAPQHGPAHDEWPAYDPEKARALLREAGYAGQRIVVQTNRRFPNMFDNAVLIHAYLRDAGFNADLAVLDWASQLSNYQKGRYQLSSFSYSARFDPALTYDALIGDRSKRATAQWHSAQAAALLDRANRSAVEAERQAAFDALHHQMAADVPIIGLYNGVAVAATRANVTGFHNWAANLPVLWGVAKEGE